MTEQRRIPSVIPLIVSVLIAPFLALTLGFTIPAQAAEPAGDTIVILHSNDVHCAGLATAKNAIGYAGIAQAANDARTAQGADHVTLVDAGDAIQGQPIGTLSQGGDLVHLMNAAAYDVAVPGNHEFDYGIPRLLELARSSAQYPYVSCNILNTETNEPLFEPYKLIDYTIGGETVTVAYLGITTPTTLTSESPTIFENAAGKTVWSFYGDETGEALYAQVQASVNAATAAGADYVIAVSHLGKDGSSTVPERYTSTAVVAHTTGIDGVIDGHSHEIYNTEIPNADGVMVPVAQCGTQFQAFGTMTITPDGTPGPEDVTSALTVAANLAEPVAQDPTVAQTVTDVQSGLDEELDRVIGQSIVGLSVYGPDDEGNPWWWVARMRETNLGDYVADAYRALLDSDVALINGGGIRAPQTAIAPLSNNTFGFAPGTLTYRDFISINSFANTLSMVEVTGQNLLDALEYSVRKLTPAFDDATESTGSFLQVSGLSFTARVDIPSPIIENANGGFASVNPALTRRVRNVMVGDEPLDPAKTYTLTSIGLILSPAGDYTMFKDCTYLKADAGLDYEALASYLQNDLKGVIGKTYADPAGQGRITLSSALPGVQTDTVYRLYNPYLDGAHLLTDDLNEVQTLTGLGWVNEGPRFAEYGDPVPECTPVFRLYNENNGDHFFTKSHPEVERLVGLNEGWVYEDICWYAPVHGGQDVYRLYNPYQTANGGLGNHLWTVRPTEKDELVDLGWKDEGVAWLAIG